MGCARDERDSLSLAHNPMVGFCERGNEQSGSTKDRAFLDQLSNYQHLNGQSVQLC